MRAIAAGPWWQSAVIYQVYPHSFQDSDGDGIGDLRGIIHRLAYLVELGIDGACISLILFCALGDIFLNNFTFCGVTSVSNVIIALKYTSRAKASHTTVG